VGEEAAVTAVYFVAFYFVGKAVHQPLLVGLAGAAADKFAFVASTEHAGEGHGQRGADRAFLTPRRREAARP